MTETVEVSALRKNPELFRIILLKTIEELTASISEDNTTTNLKENAEILKKQVEVLQPVFKKSMDDLTSSMWNQSDISHKVLFINQRETTYPPDFIAWRPNTGEVPVVNLRGHYLTDTRERFQFKIKKCKAESEELKKILYTKAAALRKSFKKISRAEESLIKLNNDYEKIIKYDS